jgi:hypothetical protein
MNERTLITGLLVGVLYGLWLLAGFVDYLCHRGADIAKTSGAPESWLHLAQFAVLSVGMLLATMLAITPLAFTMLIIAVGAHSVLSYVDVAYPQGRRYISPLEQHSHSFMDVLPVVSVGLIAVLNWKDLTTAGWAFQVRKPSLSSGELALLLGSFFTLAGAPILEELVRTTRTQSATAASPPLSSRRNKGNERHESGLSRCAGSANMLRAMDSLLPVNCVERKVRAKAARRAI